MSDEKQKIYTEKDLEKVAERALSAQTKRAQNSAYRDAGFETGSRIASCYAQQKRFEEQAEQSIQKPNYREL